MTWHEESHTLFIPFTSDTSVPILNEHTNDALQIVVESGFTSVPNRCFSAYINAEYIELPDSITTLGDNIFIKTKIINKVKHCY